MTSDHYDDAHSDSPKQYSSPTLSSRASYESDDSLRALELADGPAFMPSREPRARSYSMSGFAFDNDLLPLTTSVSEPDEVRAVGSEKSIGLLNGAWRLLSRTRCMRALE
jgi:hypothetical protein